VTIIMIITIRVIMLDKTPKKHTQLIQQFTTVTALTAPSPRSSRSIQT
jgi:hypothetical protein